MTVPFEPEARSGGIAVEMVRSDPVSEGVVLVEYYDEAERATYVLAVRRDSLTPSLRAPPPLELASG